MSRSKHRQRGIQQWNPPPLTPDAPSSFAGTQDVVSATECTGLAAQPPLDEAAAHADAALGALHAQKPQGNPGKGNPNNDPSEIRFHRG